MKEIHIEPLKGEEREKRADLDWVSEVVLLVDFVKSKLGQKGVVELGEHLGSIEKLAWKNIIARALRATKTWHTLLMIPCHIPRVFISMTRAIASVLPSFLIL